VLYLILYIAILADLPVLYSHVYIIFTNCVDMPC